MDNINEVSPRGWGGTTSTMKKHHKIESPWALANWMKKRDFKSHYKNDPEGTKSKKEPEKKPEFKDEDKKLKFKEWLDLREHKKCKCGKNCKCGKDCPCHKKHGLKYAFNVEGEPTEVEE